MTSETMTVIRSIELLEDSVQGAKGPAEEAVRVLTKEG